MAGSLPREATFESWYEAATFRDARKFMCILSYRTLEPAFLDARPSSSVHQMVRIAGTALGDIVTPHLVAVFYFSPSQCLFTSVRHRIGIAWRGRLSCIGGA